MAKFTDFGYNTPVMKFLVAVFLWAVVWMMGPGAVWAANARRVSPTPTLTATPTLTDEAKMASESAKAEAAKKITETTPEVKDRFVMLLAKQEPGAIFTNPLKHGIRAAVAAGVPANTLVLLLLLPVVACLIAGARQVIGLRGFGIYMPAALAIAFVATGPVVGIGLFLVIVTVSTLVRMVLRRLKVRLQYLPRMAVILWMVSLVVLALSFATPWLKLVDVSSLSIFPILFLVLLAEDFTRVQIGKSVRTAIQLTSETLVLAVASYGLLTLGKLQELALLYPEITLATVLMFNLLLGKYVGLRLLEIWRFRKLINS